MPWFDEGDRLRHEYGKNTCYACNARLTPADYARGTLSPDEPSPYDTYLDALEIDFVGGYGMFLDPLPYPEDPSDPEWDPTDPDFDPNPPQFPHVVVCKDCAKQLMETVPWIKRLLEPHACS